MTKTQALNSGLAPGCPTCHAPVKQLGQLCPACSKAHRAKNHAAMDADKRKPIRCAALGLDHGVTHVLFQHKTSPMIGYYMARDTYHAIPIGTTATPEEAH